MIERFGKFQSIRSSGIHFKIPFVDKVVGRVNLKVQQLDVSIETKTKDNVFVKLRVSVQYKVIDNQIYDAFYKLQDHREQITSYVFDVVRAEVPKMVIDDVFEKKNNIAFAVKAELNDAIGDETNSNLILLPNSPQAGSDMLNNMVAAFSASNQIGEEFQKTKAKPTRTSKRYKREQDKKRRDNSLDSLNNE